MNKDLFKEHIGKVGIFKTLDGYYLLNLATGEVILDTTKHELYEKETGLLLKGVLKDLLEKSYNYEDELEITDYGDGLCYSLESLTRQEVLFDTDVYTIGSKIEG